LAARRPADDDQIDAGSLRRTSAVFVIELSQLAQLDKRAD
jgi:hypothetical protein